MPRFEHGLHGQLRFRMVTFPAGQAASVVHDAAVRSRGTASVKRLTTIREQPVPLFKPNVTDRYGIENVFTSVSSPALRIGTRTVSLFSFGVFSSVMIETCATVISPVRFPLP